MLKACTRCVNSWLPRMRGVNGSRSPRGVVGIRTTPVVHSLYQERRKMNRNGGAGKTYLRAKRAI